LFAIKQLSSADALRYGSLTFRYVQPRLHRIDENPHIIAFGAESTSSSRPIGLVVVERQPGIRVYNIISLFVEEEFRRLGLGSTLLKQVESSLQAEHCSTLKMIYYAGKAITPVLESFLHHTGWSPPSLEGKVYKADTRISGAPWLKKIGLPNTMSSFYWRDLCVEERKRLIELEDKLYLPFLSPFKKDLTLEASNSLGLKVEGETVGWCITYRIAEDTILYDSVFVKPEYQLSGCSFILLGQSIALQLEQQIPYAMFAVNESSPYMRKIVDRWLAPYTVQVSEKRLAIKIF